MNIVFMGTPDLAAKVLDKLIQSKHNILAVVTQPDRPKGRGKKLHYSPVKELALSHDIPILQPNRVREEFIQVLKGYKADVIVVAAFGQILPQKLLDLPKYGCINVHASLLPKYRGAAPIQWAIINGEEKTGVTIMQMDAGIDTGDMIIKSEVILDKKETAASLHDKLALCGGNLIVEALDLLEEGRAGKTKQKDEDASYVKMIDKSLGKIDFTLPAIQIERLIRGLNPWPSAYTFLKGKSLKIWESEVIEKDKENILQKNSKNKADETLPGTIIQITNDSIIVKTGQDNLKIKQVQLEGKKRMDVESFLRGNKVETGTILGE